MLEAYYSAFISETDNLSKRVNNVEQFINLYSKLTYYANKQTIY